MSYGVDIDCLGIHFGNALKLNGLVLICGLDCPIYEKAVEPQPAVVKSCGAESMATTVSISFLLMLPPAYAVGTARPFATVNRIGCHSACAGKPHALMLARVLDFCIDTSECCTS